MCDSCATHLPRPGTQTKLCSLRYWSVLCRAVLTESAISIKMLSYCTRIVPGSPRVHPSHSPTLAVRRSAVTITHGPNDEFPLQGCTREHLLEDAVWGLPHARPRCGSRQITKTKNRSLASPPLTCAHILADLVRNVRPALHVVQRQQIPCSRIPYDALGSARSLQRPQRSGRSRSTGEAHRTLPARAVYALYQKSRTGKTVGPTEPTQAHVV